MACGVFYGHTSKKNRNKITILWKGEATVEGKITISINNGGYTVDYPNRSYKQLMADLIAVTILVAHQRLRRYELIRLIKRFWKKYKDVQYISSH